MSDTTIWSITLESSIAILFVSIMNIQSSITLLENIYNTGVTHDNCNVFIAKATGDSMGPDMFGNFYFTKLQNC